jgi:putative flippase GtrA
LGRGVDVNLVSKVSSRFQKYDAIGYLIIGGFSSLLNLVTFAFSIEIGLSSYLAVAIGNLLATVAYFFSLSKLFSGPGSVSSIVRFLLSVVAYYFISISLLDALNIFLDNLVWCRAIAIALVAPVNYFVQKHFVFKS